MEFSNFTNEVEVSIDILFTRMRKISETGRPFKESQIKFLRIPSGNSRTSKFTLSVPSKGTDNCRNMLSFGKLVHLGISMYSKYSSEMQQQVKP